MHCTGRGRRAQVGRAGRQGWVPCRHPCRRGRRRSAGWRPGSEQLASKRVGTATCNSRAQLAALQLTVAGSAKASLNRSKVQAPSRASRSAMAGGGAKLLARGCLLSSYRLWSVGQLLRERKTAVPSPAEP